MATKKAKKKKNNNNNLPEPGATFLIPLDDGRFGLCRVIRRDENRFGSNEIILAELSSWIGSKSPDLTDPDLRRVLKLTHHKWRGQAERVWTDCPAPSSFQYVGSIEPTANERRVTCMKHGSWAAFPYHRLMQWRWEHHRKRVLAEDEERKRQQEAVTAQVPKRKAPTLEGLSRSTPFKDWKGLVPSKTLLASRKVISDSIDALRALGTKSNRKKVLAVIRAGVEQFNDLDERAQFINSIERENITDAFNDMAAAAGVIDIDDVIEDCRDW